MVNEKEQDDGVAAFFEIETEKVLEVQMIYFDKRYSVFPRMQYGKNTGLIWGETRYCKKYDDQNGHPERKDGLAAPMIWTQDRANLLKNLLVINLNDDFIPMIRARIAQQERQSHFWFCLF